MFKHTRTKQELIDAGSKLGVPGVSHYNRKYTRENIGELESLVDLWENMSESEREIRRTSLRNLKKMAVSNGVYCVRKYTAENKRELEDRLVLRLQTQQPKTISVDYGVDEVGPPRPEYREDYKVSDNVVLNDDDSDNYEELHNEFLKVRERELESRSGSTLLCVLSVGFTCLFATGGLYFLNKQNKAKDVSTNAVQPPKPLRNNLESFD